MTKYFKLTNKTNENEQQKRGSKETYGRVGKQAPKEIDRLDRKGMDRCSDKHIRTDKRGSRGISDIPSNAK